jgi:fumarylpyruvate hydrolase
MGPDLILPLWQPPLLAVAGDSRRFPVRRVWCVGRNYAEHAREMGADPSREAPFFFMKAADAVAVGDSDPARIAVPYPSATADLHHEVELVVALGPGATVFGYAVGIDLTRRDVQAEAKDKRRPWDMGKSFPGAAPVGPLHPAAAIGHPRRGAVRLSVNGRPRQEGDLGQMIYSVDEVIGHLSRYQTLLPGDLVFTGTPAGVGAVGPGDVMEASIEGLGGITVTVLPPA